MEREWILTVLEQGMNDGHCYGLCKKQGIFQILLGFSSSPLCDEHFQVHTVSSFRRLLLQSSDRNMVVFLLCRGGGHVQGWCDRRGGEGQGGMEADDAVILKGNSWNKGDFSAV